MITFKDIGINNTDNNNNNNNNKSTINTNNLSSNSITNNNNNNKKSTKLKNNIISYRSSNNLFSLSFQKQTYNKTTSTTNNTLLAIGSYNISQNNKLEIISLENKKTNLQLTKTASYNLDFPITKMKWSPDIYNSNILITASDIIRVFQYNNTDTCNNITLVGNLYNKTDIFKAPITSFDWSNFDYSNIIASSVDSTVTMYDINKSTSLFRLQVSDNEVFDTSFCSENKNIFYTAGGDGYIKCFDVRECYSNKINSTYKTLVDNSNSGNSNNSSKSIVKMSVNKLNSNLIAYTFLDSNKVGITDVRNNKKELARFNAHESIVSDIAWNKNSSNYFTTVGLDNKVLIWDVDYIKDFYDSSTNKNSSIDLSNTKIQPSMEYTNECENLSVEWSEDNWIAITGDNILKLLRV